jgi:hypothetical protein
VEVVIADLRSRPSVGAFEEIHARHLWDEYSWALQEGPFDAPIIFSLSAGFDLTLQAFIEVEVEKLPKYSQVFLSVLAFEEDPDSDEEECLGCTWIEGIVKLVAEAVNERACRRSLCLIGPNRADAIGYEIDGTGIVWSMLSRAVALDLLQTYVDELIDPDADLSPMAGEIVEAFLTETRDDPESGVFLEFLRHFGEKFRSIIEDEDVLPSLKEMRRKLLEAWDK